MTKSNIVGNDDADGEVDELKKEIDEFCKEFEDILSDTDLKA